MFVRLSFARSKVFVSPEFMSDETKLFVLQVRSKGLLEADVFEVVGV